MIHDPSQLIKQHTKLAMEFKNSSGNEFIKFKPNTETKEPKAGVNLPKAEALKTNTVMSY